MILKNSLVLITSWIVSRLSIITCDVSVPGKSFQICLDDIETSRKDNNCNIPRHEVNSSCNSKIDPYNFTLSKTNDLKLLCRDDKSLTFNWNSSENKYYFIEYSREGSSGSEFTNITQCNYQTIYPLGSQQQYSIQLYSFSLSSKVFFKSQNIAESTTDIVAPRTPVKNLKTALSLENKLYRATITWEPGTDLSCFYEVVWYRKYRKNPPEPFVHSTVSLRQQLVTEFNMTGLDLGAKYEFSIKSIGSTTWNRKESKPNWLKISIPSCFETYKNLSRCKPNMPKNLTITILPLKNININDTNNLINIKLNWKKPKFQPEYYIATLFSFNENSIENFSNLTNLTIPGENNYVIFENIDMELYYRAKLMAYSEDKFSNPAYCSINYPEVKENNDKVNPADISKDYGEILADGPADMSKNYSKTYDKQNNSLMHWLWITLLPGTFIITLVFVFRAKARNNFYKHLSLEQNMDGAIEKYTVKDTGDFKWELNETKLSLSKVIGTGAFGVVQKGLYSLDSKSKTDVAVKMLKERATDEQITQFYNEIDIMKSVPRHPHIVYLIGVITRNRPKNPLMLVEFCAKGDLQSFLRRVWLGRVVSSKKGKYTNTNVYSDNYTKFSNRIYNMDVSPLIDDEYDLQCKDLLSFARQIVIGMEFLANLKIVHRDLATRNILVAENNTIKISDFGLSRDVYTNNVYQKVTGGKLPFRWMALESLTHQVYTTASDVWSFGIVLWEIVTLGETPYPGIKTEDLIPLLRNNYRMENPVNCSEELYQIMIDCWRECTSQRPSFPDLRELFDKLLESEMQYICLEDVKKINLNHYENFKNNVSDRYIVQSNKIS